MKEPSSLLSRVGEGEILYYLGTKATKSFSRNLKTSVFLSVDALIIFEHFVATS